MDQCWGGNPLKRPNITALKEALTDISTRDNITHLQISQESSCYKIHRIRESTRIQWDHQPVGEEKDDAMSEGEDEGETADMGVVETEVNGASAISYSTGEREREREYILMEVYFQGVKYSQIFSAVIKDACMVLASGPPGLEGGQSSLCCCNRRCLHDLS